jgi:hypothetical protein
MQVPAAQAARQKAAPASPRLGRRDVGAERHRRLAALRARVVVAQCRLLVCNLQLWPATGRLLRLRLLRLHRRAGRQMRRRELRLPLPLLHCACGPGLVSLLLPHLLPPALVFAAARGRTAAPGPCIQA